MEFSNPFRHPRKFIFLFLFFGFSETLADNLIIFSWSKVTIMAGVMLCVQTTLNIDQSMGQESPSSSHDANPEERGPNS